VHDPGRPGPSGRLDHVRRATDVDGLELGGGAVEAVERRDVADRVAAVDRAQERVRVAHVGPAVVHVVAGLAEGARDVPAHEAASSPRDVDAHPSHHLDG